MDLVLASKPPCPGVRFYPTDEELFMYYLKRKVMAKSFPHQMMSEVDVYRYAPWDLPHMSCLKTKDLYWYFFCPRLKKYPNGSKTHRLTEFGYWKSTGIDRTSHYRGRLVGKIKTLIFHRGKPPGGERTDWVMHEYRLEDQLLADKGISQDTYVICKIYQKSGLGPKNGEHYGAPFVEEEWESDDNDANVETDVGPALQPENVFPADNNLNGLNTSVGLTPSYTEQLTPSITTEQTVPLETQQVGPPDEPLANRLEDNVDNNDFFNGLEDLVVNGSHSTAHLNLSDWPAYRDTGYVELNDFCNSREDIDANRPQSSAEHFDWLKFLAADTDGFVELNDLN